MKDLLEKIKLYPIYILGFTIWLLLASTQQLYKHRVLQSILILIFFVPAFLIALITSIYFYWFNVLGDDDV